MPGKYANVQITGVAPPSTVLVVGATGSIGRLVVAEALRQGYRVRALVREPKRAAQILPRDTELVQGEVTLRDGLADVVRGVEAVIFTLGAGSVRGESARDVDYGGVRNILNALNDPKPRIALMTAIGVTKRIDARLGVLEGHDWKRRSERLVRASGCTYTIVRPGWFDAHEVNQHRLALLQGDRRWASNPGDGVVAREQVAQTLVQSLSTPAAGNKTVELVAEHGLSTQDFNALFAATKIDTPGSLDGVDDKYNMPLAHEPACVRDELAFQLVRQENGRASLQPPLPAYTADGHGGDR